MRPRRTLLLCFLLFAGLGESPSLVAQDAPPLRIGVILNEPLAFYEQQDYLQGILIESLEGMAANTGWQISYHPGSLAENLRNLETGEIDAIAGLARHQAPGEELEFSSESLLEVWGQVYVRPETELPSFFDLAGKPLALSRDNPHTRQLKELCNKFAIACQGVEVEGFEAVLQRVESGEAVAGLVNQLYARRHAPQYALQATPVLLEPLSMHLAVRAGTQAEILHAFDQAVAVWHGQANSLLQQSLAQWSAPLPARHSPLLLLWRKWGHWLAPFLPGVLLLGAAWFFGTRWRIRRHTAECRAQLEILGRSERQYRMLVESLPYGLQEADTQGVILFTNTAEHQIRRYGGGELIGKAMPDMAASEEEKTRFQAYLRRVLKEQPEPEPYYQKIVRKDGRIADLRWEWNYKRDERGNILGFFALVTDVTEIQSAKEKILAQHSSLKKTADERAADLREAYDDLLITAAVFESTAEGNLVTDLQGRIQTVNPALKLISGYPPEELLGRPLALLSAQRQAEKFHARLLEILAAKGQWQGEISNRRKSGQVYPAWLSINTVRNAQEQATHYVALLSDITRRKQYEQQIWRQANYDALTGLPNRNLFHRRLGQAIEEAAKDGHAVGLMFIDLDKFKEVNDTLGHDAGDELLKAATRRLSECVRKRDTVARMGGDEFTVILPHLENQEVAAEIARKILKQLDTPFEILGHGVNISGSLGIVIYPRHGENLATLLKHADIAMYRIKEAGRNGFCFYPGDAS
jgi:diguanylate cyclase (GGDEF)-like protein/PAS domain S-box-containing protein